MKRVVAAFAAAVLSLSAASLRADLLGTKVDGSLTFGANPKNYFDPANGHVPPGYGNSVSPNGVVIDAGVEFGYDDALNRNIADFTGNGLTVRDTCHISPNCGGNSPFQMLFTDLSFGSVTLLTNDLGVTYSFSGDTLTVNYLGNTTADSNSTATFSIGTPAQQTPEPGTIGLVATGILGAVGAIRRRVVV